jgi:small-conductance mechanosensitive channel
MLKQYSPVTSSEQFDKFSENYVISDEKFMDNFMRTNFKKTEMSNEDLKNAISDIKEVIASIQSWLSHIRGEIELFKRNDNDEYLDENGSVIAEPHKNLDKLVERESLLKTDIELLIERNKMYWGGDLDF